MSLRLDRCRFSRRFAVFAPCPGHRIATQSAEIDATRRAEIVEICTDWSVLSTPPYPFFVGRAALDPRSLNFFALHCDFLQKVCNKEVFFLPSTALFYKKFAKKEGVFFALHCDFIHIYSMTLYFSVWRWAECHTFFILFGLALGGMSYFFHTFRASDATVASHLAHGRIPSGGTALPICLLTAVLPPHHLQGGDGGKDCSAARSSFVRARPPSA